MDNIQKIKSKRADLSVVAFVFLVLLLLGYTLYSMTANRNRVSSKITEYDIPESFSLEKKELEYRMLKLYEECTYENYQLDGNYNGLEEWKDINSINLSKERIESCLVKKSILAKTEMVPLEEPNKFRLYVLIEQGKSNIDNIDHREIDAELKEFQITMGKNTRFKTELKTNININKIGLLSHGQIEEIIICEQENCIEKINNELFYIEVEEIKDDKKNIVELNYKFKSRREFLIENQFKSKEFSILIPYEKKISEENIE